MVLATTDIALLAICGRLVRGMHVTTLVAVGLGSQGIGVDGGC